MINSIAFPFILLSIILLINFIFNERNQYYYLSRYGIGKQFKIIVMKAVRNLLLSVKNKLNISVIESLLRILSIFTFSIVVKTIWKEEVISLDLGISILVICFVAITILDNFLSKQSSIFQLKDHASSLSMIVILTIMNLEFSIQNRKIDIINNLLSLSFCLYLTILVFTNLRKINIRKKSVKIILEATVVLVLGELLYQKNILSLDLINPYISIVILIPYILTANLFERITSKQIINQDRSFLPYYFGVFLIVMRLLFWKI